jgi:hypothetical protein
MVDATEARLNQVGENLYYDGETVALDGNYDNDGKTIDGDHVRAALDAIAGGATSVEFEDAVIRDDPCIDSGIIIDAGSNTRHTNVPDVRDLLASVEN